MGFENKQSLPPKFILKKMIAIIILRGQLFRNLHKICLARSLSDEYVMSSCLVLAFAIVKNII